MGSLPLTCKAVYLKSFKVSWLSTVQLHFPGLTWLPLPRCFTIPERCVVLLSGSEAWGSSVYSRGLHSWPCLLAADDAFNDSSASATVFDFQPFRHIDAGGVVEGSWRIGTNDVWRKHFSPVIASPCLPYQRRLRHVIEITDPIIRLQPCPPPLDDAVEYSSSTFLSRNVLNWNSPLPRTAPLTRVCCRSTFSSTGWVIRRLTAVELGRAYDVPSCLLSWCSTWASAHVGSLPFLGVAPPRVLLRAWHALFGSGSSTGGGAQEHVEGTTALSGHVEGTTTELSTGVECTATLPNGALTPTDCFRLGEQDDEEAEKEVAAYVKSTKADDAAVPVDLWDNAIWELGWHDDKRLESFAARTPPFQPLQVLRRFLAYCWRRRVLLSFVHYFWRQHAVQLPRTLFGIVSARLPDEASAECHADLAAGQECLQRVHLSDWWEWQGGSRLLFWRWPEAHRVAARDGYAAFVKGELPRYRKPQPKQPDDVVRLLVRAKLWVVRLRGYIRAGIVKSLTSYFSVPKGEADIRMVYDASKSGLNEALWAPNFGLPTVNVLTRSVDDASWMGDLDVGEMFLNFCLDPKLQEYCGVDLRPYFGDELRKGETLWERWVRCMMGLKISPYVCIKGMLLAMEMVFGDKNDAKNVYRWLDVVLNLPGMDSYDPSKPRVWRRKNEKGDMAATTVGYVDDLRSADGTKEGCWTLMNITGARMSYLGIQCAARKTRPPSRSPGAWAGSVVVIREKGVGVKCSTEKWNKAKSLLTSIKEEMDKDGMLD